MSFNNVLFHFILFLISNWHCALPCCQAGFHQLSVYSSLSLSVCASRPHTCSPLCSDWMSRKAMSSYWLKIASRAGAKNRRIYKGRRLSEARCTYAAVAGKDETLRERERKIAKGRRTPFLSVPRHGAVFHKKGRNDMLSFSACPGLGVTRWGWGLHDYFLPSSTSHVFFPLFS